jgi:hypothetical protein
MPDSAPFRDDASHSLPVGYGYASNGITKGRHLRETDGVSQWHAEEPMPEGKPDGSRRPAYSATDGSFWRNR